jgi:nucleoside-diphosphate-sugar epimerase
LERQPAVPTRLIALSSMSAKSKRESPDPAERQLAARLRASEERILAIGERRGIACTIFRPTLIYGAGTDRSLAPIARFARRRHVLPIPIGAIGLRQPVHVADLATACAAALENPATYGKVYELGGGERLTFATMLSRLRAAQPGFVLSIPVPLTALRMLAPALGFSAGAIKRMREPLIADNDPAARDFAYAPRTFRGEDVLAAG